MRGQSQRCHHVPRYLLDPLTPLIYLEGRDNARSEPTLSPKTQPRQKPTERRLLIGLVSQSGGYSCTPIRVGGNYEILVQIETVSW